MSKTKIAGIMRSDVFSPNHVGNDAAIFHLTAEHLRKRGYEVAIYSEEEFLRSDIEEEVLVTMCRESASIDKLEELESCGRLVINSSAGIDNCVREKMTSLFRMHEIPQPQSLVVNTNESVVGRLKEAGIESCWVKRGDAHSLHKEDITYCRNAEEAQEVLHEYFLRGIRRAVINCHLPGDWVKFYGVAGDNFFYWYYPFAGVEDGMRDSGSRRSPEPDAESLRRICTKAAEALDVEVFGGAGIVGSDGSFRIVDFHDWPSFAPCRKEAAPKIARYVISRIKQHEKKL